MPAVQQRSVGPAAGGTGPLQSSGRSRGPGSLHELLEMQSRDLKRRQKELLESTLPSLAATIRTVEHSRPKSREHQVKRARPRKLVTGNTRTTAHLAHGAYNRLVSRGSDSTSHVSLHLKPIEVEDSVAGIIHAKAVARRLKARHTRPPYDEGSDLVAQAGMSTVERRPIRPGSGDIRAARRDPGLVDQLYVTTILNAANLDFSEAAAEHAIFSAANEANAQGRIQEQQDYIQSKAEARAAVREAHERSRGLKRRLKPSGSNLVPVGGGDKGGEFSVSPRPMAGDLTVESMNPTVPENGDIHKQLTRMAEISSRELSSRATAAREVRNNSRADSSRKRSRHKKRCSSRGSSRDSRSTGLMSRADSRSSPGLSSRDGPSGGMLIVDVEGASEDDDDFDSDDSEFEGMTAQEIARVKAQRAAKSLGIHTPMVNLTPVVPVSFGEAFGDDGLQAFNDAQDVDSPLPMLSSRAGTPSSSLSSSRDKTPRLGSAGGQGQRRRRRPGSSSRGGAVVATRESFIGANARQKFFEQLGQGTDQSGDRPSSPQMSARAIYLQRCAQPMQLLTVGVRGGPSGGNDVAMRVRMENIAKVADVWEEVATRLGIPRERQILRDIGGELLLSPSKPLTDLPMKDASPRRGGANQTREVWLNLTCQGSPRSPLGNSPLGKIGGGAGGGLIGTVKKAKPKPKSKKKDDKKGGPKTMEQAAGKKGEEGKRGGKKGKKTKPPPPRPKPVDLRGGSALFLKQERVLNAKRRQAVSTIEIDNPERGSTRRQQLSVTPLPLLVGRSADERKDLLGRWIDEMDEDAAKEACEEAHLELPPGAFVTIVAQMMLRMHYLQPSGTETSVRGNTVGGGGPTGSVVQLNNFRIGNTLAIAYAAGLQRMTEQGAVLRRLEMANNALTDEGIVAISRALARASTLQALDLSNNRIGRDGAEALGRLVNTDTCALQELVVSNSRAGDQGGRKLIEALRDQVTVTALDISYNQLGSQIISKSLYDLLCDNSQLARLQLGWNEFTGRSLALVGPALTENIALEHLDLTWNMVGNEGGVALGSALRHNKTLTHLDLTHCNIQERGTMVLADMLIENKTLSRVVLDENPIGKRGGRAILRALRSVVLYQISRTMSLCKCNFNYQSEEVLFDPSEPGGKYTLDLTVPYDRMVANELVELAWREVGENWENEKLDGKPFELPEPPDDVVWTRDDYKLPEAGILSLRYKPTKRVPRMEQVIDEGMFESLLSMMREKHVVDSGFGLLQLATEEWYFSARFAGILLEEFKDPAIRVKAMTHLMPRVVDSAHWNGSVMCKLDESECKGLEMKVGQLFYFSPTNPTGRYKIELANRHERMIAYKLIAISSEERIFRKEHGLIDTSQKGDYDNWRNETLNGKPWDYDEDNPMASKLPSSGLLEFDYVSTNVAHRMVDIMPIANDDLDSLLGDIRQLHLTVKVHEKPPEPEPEAEQEPEPVPEPEPEPEASAKPEIPPEWEERVENLQQRLPLLTREDYILALEKTGGNAGRALKVLKRGYAAKEAEAKKLQAEEHEAAEKAKWAAMEAQALAEAAEEARKAAAPAGGANPLAGRRGRRRRGSIVGMDDLPPAMDTSSDQAALNVEVPATPAPRAAAASEGDTTSSRTPQSSIKGERRGRRRRRSVTQIAFEGGESTSGSDDDGATGKSVAASASKLARVAQRNLRPAWWLASALVRVRTTDTERDNIILKRTLLLLRRATSAYYFTSAQVESILAEMDMAGRVEAMVLFFARVLDLEFHHQHARLEVLLPSPKQQQQYAQRIGPANLFNPMYPDGHYRLHLKIPEDRSVATMLAELSAEPGENWLNETYDGYPFDFGPHLLSGDHNGIVELDFCTGAGTASFPLRCKLARRHLMPGPERWKVIPENLVHKASLQLEPKAFDDVEDRSAYVLDADGTLKTLHKVFADCDRDRSGYLGKGEFIAAMQRLLGEISMSAAEFIWKEHVTSSQDKRTSGIFYNAAAGSAESNENEEAQARLGEDDFGTLFRKLRALGRMRG